MKNFNRKKFQGFWFILLMLSFSCTRDEVIKKGAQSSSGSDPLNTSTSSNLSLKYDPSDIVVSKNLEVSGVVVKLENGGMPITNCYAAPILPQGLSINPLNCSIQGLSQELFEKKEFTITATNAKESVSTKIFLTGVLLPTLKFISSSGPRPIDTCIGPYSVAVVNINDQFVNVNAPHSLALSHTAPGGGFFGADGCSGNEITLIEISELGFSEKFYFKTDKVGTFDIKVNANGFMGFTSISQKVSTKLRASNTWIANTSIGSTPTARSDFSTIWTGSEMIIWGGKVGSNQPTNTGGRYNPATDSWGNPVSTPSTNLPGARYGHTAVWTGSEMIIWGGKVGTTAINTGGRYNPATDSWGNPVSTLNAPAERFGHSAVWTGSEMIIWGGKNNQPTNTGGRYNPATDSWGNPLSTSSAPSNRAYHSAIWTGSEMIVWGGNLGSSATNTGGRYDPGMDKWSTLPILNAPEARFGHSAVWTGSEMIIWGGKSENSYFRNGRFYNPKSQEWSSTLIETNEAPSAREGHSAVWTGSEMIIWGGHDGSNDLSSGHKYNLSNNKWEEITITASPSKRSFHGAIWTGTEMIIWGGKIGSTASNTGGRYNPANDSWGTPLSTSGTPLARFGHSAVWTGSEMIIWGGKIGSTASNTGGRYNPATDSWGNPLTTSNAPSARFGHSAVWTDEEMIIWGGNFGTTAINTGKLYDPATDSWGNPLSTSSAPAARSGHSAVWTGSEMIIWGGYDGSDYLNDGKFYDLGSSSWSSGPIASTDAPTARSGHSAVWTGTEMIVWGGYDGSNYLNDGKRYNHSERNWHPFEPQGAAPPKRHSHSAIWTGGSNPKMIIWGGYDTTDLQSGAIYDYQSNTWVGETHSTNAPSARSGHSAVWTGSEMIIWGGKKSSATNGLNDGALYVP